MWPPAVVHQQQPDRALPPPFPHPHTHTHSHRHTYTCHTALLFYTTQEPTGLTTRSTAHPSCHTRSQTRAQSRRTTTFACGCPQHMHTALIIAAFCLHAYAAVLILCLQRAQLDGCSTPLSCLLGHLFSSLMPSLACCLCFLRSYNSSHPLFYPYVLNPDLNPHSLYSTQVWTQQIQAFLRVSAVAVCVSVSV